MGVDESRILFKRLFVEAPRLEHVLLDFIAKEEASFEEELVSFRVVGAMLGQRFFFRLRETQAQSGSDLRCDVILHGEQFGRQSVVFLTPEPRACGCVNELS